MKNKQHTLPSFFLISSAVDGNENAIEKLLLFYEAYIEYSCAVTPQIRQTGNRLSGNAGTAYASLLA